MESRRLSSACPCPQKDSQQNRQPGSDLESSSESNKKRKTCSNSDHATEEDTLQQSRPDSSVSQADSELPKNKTASADMTSSEAVTLISHPEVTSGPGSAMFTVERVADGAGGYITLGKMDGIYTAPWPTLPQQSAKAKKFSITDSDVVLLGYPKSGTHWLWEILHLLLRERSEPTTLRKERLMFSFSSQEFFDMLEPPRVFNTHSSFQNLPRCLQDGTVKSKTIFLVRNPKDVAVSFYHFLLKTEDFRYRGSWDGFFLLFMEGKVPGGSWFDYVLDWEKRFNDHPDFPVHYVYYEDLKMDCSGEIKRISDYLGLDRSTELIEAIAEACSFKRMKQHAIGLDKQEGNSNLGDIIYRKGIVGDWKNWFTEEQNRQFAELYDAKMASSVHRLKFDL